MWRQLGIKLKKASLHHLIYVLPLTSGFPTNRGAYINEKPLKGDRIWRTVIMTVMKQGNSVVVGEGAKHKILQNRIALRRDAGDLILSK